MILRKLFYISTLIIGMTSYAWAQSQFDQVIDLEIEHTSLKDALESISEQFDIRFSYSDSKLSTNRIVSAHYQNVTFKSFLDDFFARYEINYSIIGEQIVLFPNNKNQTIKVRGKVINQIDGSPIPYANIALPATSQGSSSNEYGAFELIVNKLPAEILASHLAHEKKIVYAYDEKEELLIELLPAQKQLEEVTIKSKGNKNAYYHLVKKAIRKLQKSRGDDQYAKAFYRQKSSRDSRYTEIFEMFYDIKYSPMGISDWAVQEGRYAFQQQEEFDIFLYNKNFTLLSRMFPLLQPNTDSYQLPVTAEVKQYFKLKLSDIMRYENRYIAIIDYKPLPDLEKPAPSGQLYIDFEDYSILKFKGTFADADLNIVGFSDQKSDWEKYQLDFEISFMDDQSDKLYLDYIKIDHSFDYYFNDTFVGRIQTNSLLTFYEQYFPVKSKKLGGPIDFRASDMDLIDQLGYDPTFWREHPIVRRTPIEDKLIQDFEQNEAFGAVFMNNNDEVVLLPDHTKSEQAEQLIAKFEAKHKNDSGHDIFVSLDRQSYLPGSKIHFSAYIFNQWSYKPLSIGSVLTLVLKNEEEDKVLSRNFDISGGASYGEIELEQNLKPGRYQLQASSNIDSLSVFQSIVTVSPFPLADKQTSIGTKFQQNVAAPEGGILLANVTTKISYRVPGQELQNSALWKVVDQEQNLIQTFYADPSGIGSFFLTPKFGKRYSLMSEHSKANITLPPVQASGLAVKVNDERSRSIRLHISHRPALPKNIFVLTTFKGRVSSVLRATLNGKKVNLDIPIQFLQTGINELIILDDVGNEISRRSVFHHKDRINIEVAGYRWRSRKNHRLELLLSISDENGKAISANLNATLSQSVQLLKQRDNMKKKLLLGEKCWTKLVAFEESGDSLFRAIDNLLIIDQRNEEEELSTTKFQTQGYRFTDSENEVWRADDEILAELSVSGSMYSQTTPTRLKKKKKSDIQANDVVWIPKLDIDSRGIATVEVKVPNKNKKLFINIQGISEDGMISNKTLEIDLSTVKADRRAFDR